jgi:2-polyprenyl-3-methyl-5-hydroxy-6-metoxy-1,4-benzoquinol methylase
MMWLDPVPSREQLREFYGEDELVPAWEALVLAEHPRASHDYRLARIASHRPPGRRMLEVGVGFGHFMMAARDAGWDMTGVDLSPEAVRYARVHQGLSVDQGEARDLYQEGSFDAIYCKDVIEHITDPLEELRVYARLLRPGGVLVVETLNIGSVVARIKGAKYPAFIPGHVTFFSLATLRRALNLAGFEILESWAGDEVPWLAHLKTQPWKRATIRLVKKLHVGPLYFASMVVYARLPTS